MALSLYSAAAALTTPARAPLASVSMMAKSKALPWSESPEHLDGMVGNAGFDPLSLSTPQNINWMREAELKHGRMCMLAWAGYVAVDVGMKFPGEKYAALTSFTAHDALVSNELFYALLLVGTFETIGTTQIYSMCVDGSDRKAGDFGFDPLGFVTPENEANWKLGELTNGARPPPRAPHSSAAASSHPDAPADAPAALHPLVSPARFRLRCADPVRRPPRDACLQRRRHAERLGSHGLPLRLSMHALPHHPRGDAVGRGAGALGHGFTPDLAVDCCLQAIAMHIFNRGDAPQTEASSPSVPPPLRGCY